MKMFLVCKKAAAVAAADSHRKKSRALDSPSVPYRNLGASYTCRTRSLFSKRLSL